MDYDRVAFGDWVRQSRMVLGYKSAASFARRLGVHRGTLKHIEDGERPANPERRQRIVELLVADLKRAKQDVDPRKIYVTAGLPFGTDSSPALKEFARIYISPYGKRTEVYETLLSVLNAMHESWASGSAAGAPQLVMAQAQATYNALLMGSRYQRDFDLALHTIRAGIRWAQAEEAVLPWFKRSQQAISTYTHVEQFVVEQVIERFKRHPDFPEIRLEHARLIALRAPLFREIGAYERSIEQAERGAALARDVGDNIVLTDLLRNRAHVRAVQGEKDLWEAAMHEAREAMGRLGRRGISDQALKGLHTYHVAEGKRRLAFDHRRPVPLATRIQLAEEAITQFALSRQQLAGWELQEVAVGTSRHPLIPRVSEAQCQIWLNPQQAIADLQRLRAEAVRDHPSLVAKIDFSLECARQLLAWRQHNPLPVFDLDARYKSQK